MLIFRNLILACAILPSVAGVSMSEVAKPDTLTASGFVETLGVNIHSHYTNTSYSDLQRIVGSLSFLGISNVRDSVPEYYPDRYRVLADAGIKFDFIVHTETPESAIPLLRPFAGSILAIEGPNEVNTWPVTYQGRSGLEAAADYQRALYSSVKGDSLLSAAPVYNLTLGGVGKSAYAPLGDLSDAVDFGTAHVYFPRGGVPTGSLDYALGIASQTTPSRPVVITESGYYTLLDGANGVSELAQSKETLTLWFDSVGHGVEHLFLYELLDELPDPSNSDLQQHFGLFRADGTPKPAAAAIRNTIKVLADEGPSQQDAGPITLSINGLPSTGHSLILQASAGHYYVALWNELPVFDEDSRSDVNNEAVTVTLSTGKHLVNARLYDPLISDKAQKTAVLSSDITVKVPDHPVLLEVFDVNLRGANELKSSISATLAHLPETNLTLIGDLSADGAGNARSNTIRGNSKANNLEGHAGNDILGGGDGNDRLTGGRGDDLFQFVSNNLSAGIDRITDFSHRHDSIGLLESAFFQGSHEDKIRASEFYASGSGVAHDKNDRLIYDTDNGNLYFDADGARGGPAVQIAKLVGHPFLDATDFLLY